MFILLGRILLWAFFGSFVVAAGCYVTAKIRERGPSLKNARKIEAKKMQKYQKQAEKQVEKEIVAEDALNSDFNLNLNTEPEQKTDVKTIVYGNGKITTNNRAWREYMQKLLSNGYLEETLYEEESDLVNLVVSAINGETKEKVEKLNFLGSMQDIKDICSMNQDVNGNILAPFELNDEVVIEDKENIYGKYMYLQLEGAETPSLYQIENVNEEELNENDVILGNEEEIEL